MRKFFPVSVMIIGNASEWEYGFVCMLPLRKDSRREAVEAGLADLDHDDFIVAEGEVDDRGIVTEVVKVTHASNGRDCTVQYAGGIMRDLGLV